MTEETQVQAQNNNDMEVSLTLSIGEINAIFGVINASAFQAVMQPLAVSISDQIRNKRIPPKQTQQEALSIVTTVTMKLSEVNTIISIINASAGFVGLMQPIIDKITSQVQALVNTSTQTASLTPQPLPSLNFQPPPALTRN